MARYELLAPHYLEFGPQRTARHCAAGMVIDSADMPPWFRPTPAMRPLDDEAKQAVREVCDEARAAGPPGAVPAFGSLHRHPGGDLEGT